MSYIVHCHATKDGKVIEQATKVELKDAIDITTQHKEAKFFKIFSHEFDGSHLEGELQENGHVDWIRVE